MPSTHSVPPTCGMGAGARAQDRRLRTAGGNRPHCHARLADDVAQECYQVSWRMRLRTRPNCIDPEQGSMGLHSTKKGVYTRL